MPTILQDALADEWTEPGLPEERVLQLATYQYPAEKMSACTVAKDFLNATNPALAFTYENLSPLV